MVGHNHSGHSHRIYRDRALTLPRACLPFYRERPVDLWAGGPTLPKYFMGYGYGLRKNRAGRPPGGLGYYLMDLPVGRYSSIAGSSSL
jgi:hypothetical protein